MKLSKTSITILIAFVLSSFFFIKAVIDKEHTIAKGQLIYLELAPVDPRSLMQGDYMNLNYAIQGNRWQFDETGQTDTLKLPPRGYVLVEVDSSKVAKFISRGAIKNSPKKSQLYIKYFNGSEWSYNIGAESYFFQEGHAKKYEKAKYGGLRVDEKGNSVLIGLFDKDLKLIQ
ncbi:MAG: GDYXXLXY domain-containing protein [Flavobacteriaceae bacterium]|jgi:uncharacterized membrane-anchored protein|nr:GDYXXLXY domain-containing protein [Flavobacteriaceae bacterium]